jgi:tripartite-type tricarboxylate transporter receptor subunit TctC
MAIHRQTITDSTTGEDVMKKILFFRGLLCLMLAVAAPTDFAHAQSAATGANQYPTKTIRFVIPFSAGGLSDILGRIVGQKLSESVGQPVIMDNRPGASGNIGAELVAKAPPDGYVLLINSINYVINPGLIRPPFDPIKDFAAVSLIASGPPLVLAVHPSLPVKSVKELVALAKTRPGELNFANSGIGTSPHLAGELLRHMTGIKIVQVPYRGSVQSIYAVIGGEVAVIFPNLTVALPHMKSGKLRALAVTSIKRAPAAPELPTMDESGLRGFEVNGFIGLLAPAATPPAIVSRLNSEIVKMRKQSDFVERFESNGMEPVASAPEPFARYMEREIAKWDKVIKTAGVRAE